MLYECAILRYGRDSECVSTVVELELVCSSLEIWVSPAVRLSATGKRCPTDKDLVFFWHRSAVTD